MVGYLEEEAVHTYTILLKQLDEGKVGNWTTCPAPKIATEYYQLDPEATMREVILSIRADESIHRDVNHRFTELVGRTESEDQ
jgi:ubiquinol oxidase